MPAPVVPRFGLWYDLRNPPPWSRPLGPLYRETIDQAVCAQFPGESVESGSERIQYPADKVIPEVTNRLAATELISDVASMP
jgi:hypothetical protein